MLKKKLRIFAVLMAFALGLVGLSAGASFTDFGKAEQDISTGTLAVAVYESDALGNEVVPSTAIAVESHKEGKAHSAYIKFDPAKTLGSTWTIEHFVTFENVGDLPLRLENPDMFAAGPSDSPLRAQIQTWIADNPAWGFTVGEVEDLPWIGTVDLAPGAKATLHFDFRAVDLKSDAMGQSVSPVFKLDAVESPVVTPLDGQSGGFYIKTA